MIAEKLMLRERIGRFAADRLNVLARMPQGSGWNDSFSYTDNCTPAFPFWFDIFIPSNILQLNVALLSFKLRAFRTYNDFSVSGTEGESGHSHSHAHDHRHGLTPNLGTGAIAVSWSHNAPVGLYQNGAGPGLDTDTASIDTDATVNAAGSSGHTHGI